MIRISLGQAILILLDNYQADNKKFNELAELYLEGLNNPKAYNKITNYATVF